MQNIILIAGGTGHLGDKIITQLLHRRAVVHAIVRVATDIKKITQLESRGVKVTMVDMTNTLEVSKACIGATCIVSALSGLDDVILETQRILLAAAVIASVPRFIPSDFCLDFRNLTPGQNRNLDLRRSFHKFLEEAPIAATTIFNGAFMDLLLGPMPLLLFKIKRVLYWGNVDQRMDFTTMDDVAAFTANVALDHNPTPRFLSIAGDRLSARQIHTTINAISPHTFRLFKAGGIGLLNGLISIAKFIAPGENTLYPAWQGMQYMRDMMEGRVHLDETDNQRYPSVQWMNVRKFLLSTANADYKLKGDQR